MGVYIWTHRILSLGLGEFFAGIMPVRCWDGKVGHLPYKPFAVYSFSERLSQLASAAAS